MPVFTPNSHDDLIAINITLSQPTVGRQSLTTLLILADDVDPGGGLFAEYASQAEVVADTANLDATTVAVAAVAFAQANPPEKILIGGVDLTGSQAASAALTAIIAAGANFYGVVYTSRTVARQLALAVAIEAMTSSGVYVLYGLQDDDADWLTSGIPAAWATAAGFERTVVYYHDDNDHDASSARLDVASFADRLSYDPDEQSAPWHAPVRSVPALTASLTATQKTFARANFANAALPFGTLTDTYVDPGKNLAGRPIDHIVTADWFRVRAQEKLADIIVANAARGQKVTVDDQGQAILGAGLEEVMQQGFDAGHFLGGEVRPLPITSTDISNQRVRFDVVTQVATGIRRATVNCFFGTDPIAA